LLVERDLENVHVDGAVVHEHGREGVVLAGADERDRPARGG